MLLLLLLLALLVACPAAAASNQPNIVFILADDLGFNELGYQNKSRGIQTPNIDALAESGVALAGYYVQPICSPTRSALMTGRYTIRLGTQSNVIYWDTPWGISLQEQFLPQQLQTVGYKTAMYGKWHLGMFKEEYTPMKRGFDEHIGYYQGCESAFTHIASCCSPGSPDSDQGFVCPKTSGKDYRGYDWFRNGAPDLSVNGTNSAVVLQNAAIDFINRQAASADAPFFLYLPFQNIHDPYTCEAQYYNQYASYTNITEDERVLWCYISELDSAVGNVTQALRQTALYENTIIIFSSDNGAPPDGSADHQQGSYPGWIARNYPLRGWKSLIWEGGTRVPGFVHSPLLPKAVQGTRNTQLYHITDWFPTIAKLAGASLPGNLDGYDIWESITTGGSSPRTEMLYNVNPLCSGSQAGAPAAALRMGSYKLLTWCYNIRGIAGANTTGPGLCPKDDNTCDPAFHSGPLLFDLEVDPTERNNIAAKQPQLVAQLLSRLEELALQSVEPMQWDPPYQGPSYFCANCSLHPASTGPFVPWEPWL